MRWILAVVLLGSGCLASAPIPDEPPRRYVPVEIQPELGDSIVSNKSDSGGPCLRERGKALELVGIAKTHYGRDRSAEFSEYTSVYFYREWIRQEIANAEKADTD